MVKVSRYYCNTTYSLTSGASLSGTGNELASDNSYMRMAPRAMDYGYPGAPDAVPSGIGATCVRRGKDYFDGDGDIIPNIDTIELLGLNLIVEGKITRTTLMPGTDGTATIYLRMGFHDGSTTTYETIWNTQNLNETTVSKIPSWHNLTRLYNILNNIDGYFYLQWNAVRSVGEVCDKSGGNCSTEEGYLLYDIDRAYFEVSWKPKGGNLFWFGKI